MKLLFAMLLSSVAFAQATFSITIPGDPSPVSITLSAQAIPSMIAGIENSPAPGVSPSTLTASVTSTTTSFSVASTVGATSGMGMCFGTAPTCTEVVFIDSISGNTITSQGSVTNGRGVFGTTAAAYASGTPFTYIQYGSAAEWMAGQMKAAITLYMTSFPGSTITTQNTTIATASATIASTVAAGFSKTP